MQEADAAFLIVVAAGAIIGLVLAIALHRGPPPTLTLGYTTNFWGSPKPWKISRETRLRHLVYFGATGSGKSTAITGLVLQDTLAGFGGIVVDPKDALVLSIASRLPPARLAHTVLFSPADTAFPPAFNPLANVPASLRTLAAAELLSSLKRLYEDNWGPRLEHVLRNCLLTLLETPEATLLDIVRLLTDPPYRTWAVEQVTNFSVRQFWEREFPGIVGARGSLANIESILNKLGVLAYPEIRNVLGQTRRGLDISAAMDAGELVLAHLPEGQLGTDAAMFLAALLLSRVQLAAQRRVSLPAAQRRPWYACFDEAQNYQTSALDKLITEGRGFGVGCVVACQYKEQLPTALRLALERNCAYQLTTKLVQDGRVHALELFKLQEPDAYDATIPLLPYRSTLPEQRGQLAAIRERSRALLARPRHEVEADIARRMNAAPVERAAQPQLHVVPNQPRPNEPRREARRVRFYDER